MKTAKSFDQLNQQEKDNLHQLFKENYPIKQIARMTKLTEHTIRRVVLPGWFEQTKLRRATQEKKPRERKGKIQVRVNRWEALYDPLRDGVVFHTSFTAERMGDPLPGRDALSQRRLEQSKEMIKPKISLAKFA